MHQVPVEEVPQRHEGHTLVVRHVAFDDGIIPFLWEALRSKVQGFVEPELAQGSILFHLDEVAHCFLGRHHGGQEGGIGRDHPFFLKALFQGERGDTKGPVLIV